MWSQGNKAEKERLACLVKPKETIVDMFAGIGYFSIMAAKRAKRLFAIDINPDSIELLRRNVMLNRLDGRVEILEGDCRKFAPLLEGVADRIFMGYLFNTEKFLPYAIMMAKDRAFIHLHRNVKTGELESLKKELVRTGKSCGVSVKVDNVQEVKSYAPKVAHVVLDLKVLKSRK